MFTSPAAPKENMLIQLQFRSPQMLMVSGIRPKTTLQQHGIPIQVDAPGVGQGMWVRHPPLRPHTTA